MITLAIAYAIVWTAVAVYLLYLGAGQHRLERTLESLERRLEESRPEGPGT